MKLPDVVIVLPTAPCREAFRLGAAIVQVPVTVAVIDMVAVAVDPNVWAPAAPEPPRATTATVKDAILKILRMKQTPTGNASGDAD